MTQTEVYNEGFVKQCQERGVDPAQVMKAAGIGNLISKGIAGVKKVHSIAKADGVGAAAKAVGNKAKAVGTNFKNTITGANEAAARTELGKGVHTTDSLSAGLSKIEAARKAKNVARVGTGAAVAGSGALAMSGDKKAAYEAGFKQACDERGANPAAVMKVAQAMDKQTI